MNRNEWRRSRFRDAVGVDPDRPTKPETGVADLLTLHELSRPFGAAIDQDIANGAPGTIRSHAALMTRLDPARRLGPRARTRIDSAHDVQLAGGITAVEPIVFGALQPPAGLLVSTWTYATDLPVGTPGVVVLENGARTRTFILCALVGGELALAWSHPVLIEPATYPTDATALALQALELGCRGRDLVKRYAPEADGIRIGSLPIVAGAVRAAEPGPVEGVAGPPRAFGDIPEVVDRLHAFSRDEVPFLVQTCLSPAGGLRAPPACFLDLTPQDGQGAERPHAAFGLGTRIEEGLIDALVRTRSPINDQLLERIPGVAAVARVSKGSLVARGTRGAVAFRAVGVVSHEGRRAIAVTNLERSLAGMNRLGLAVEGLFGSTAARAACRRRTARFVAHLDLPTNSVPASRRVYGLVVMAYAGTVVDRVGLVSR